MFFQKNQVRDFMLESQIEPLVAMQVAQGLDGVMSTGIAGGDGEVQFDGAVKSDKWPALYAALSRVPSNLIQIEDYQTPSSDTIEFKVVINDATMTEKQTLQSLEGLRCDIEDEQEDVTMYEDVDHEMNDH